MAKETLHRVQTQCERQLESVKEWIHLLYVTTERMAEMNTFEEELGVNEAV